MLEAIAAIGSLIKLLQKVFSLWRKAKREAWVSDAVDTLSEIKEAKTDEDRKRLARRLAELGNSPS